MRLQHCFIDRPPPVDEVADLLFWPVEIVRQGLFLSRYLSSAPNLSLKSLPHPKHSGSPWGDGEVVSLGVLLI